MDRKEILKELTETAFSLKPGQHSPVMELPDQQHPGRTVCYLLMVEDVRPAHVNPLSEVEGNIERMLQAQRSQQLLEQWIKRLEAKSPIVHF